MVDFTGGAAAVVGDVFNTVLNASIQKTNAASAAVTSALAEARQPPQLVADPLDNPYRVPGRPSIDELSGDEARSMFETIRQTLESAISDKLDYFLLTYFPSGGYYDRAIAWIDDAIANGGSGIRPDIEQQLWERGRGRVQAESARAEAEAMANWSDRRFPLPPGALTNQIGVIRVEAGRKLAEFGRDIAIKMFESELENTRFAVQQALAARTAAIGAAGDYIKTIMLGPQIATQLATSQVNARIQIAQALTQMYAAEVSAQEPLARFALSEADLKLRVSEANMRAQITTVEQRVKVAMEYASMLGTQAAAALNALHAGAQISGSDTTNRTL